MKNRIVVAIALLCLLAATSCAYKTCPTYSKVSTPNASKTAKV